MAESAAPGIDELRTLLHSPRPSENLQAIEAAARLHGAAAPLVADLVRLLTSEDYEPCDRRKYGFSGHAILAEDAMRTIVSIGVPPALEELRRLLGDRRIIRMPEACYDQGMYIGDYSSTTFSPAGLAAHLVPLHAENGLKLLAELTANALDEADEIGDAARNALCDLAHFAATAAPADRDAFVAEIDGIAELPVAVSPTTSRGFALRDLARYCRNVLGG